MQNAVSQAPQAVLQFRDPLDDLRRGGLRLDVGIERDFALDFLDRFGNRGFAVVYGMDDLRNDARKRIGVCHERIILQERTGPEWQLACHLQAVISRFWLLAQFAGTCRTFVASEPGPGSGTGFGISEFAKRGTIWSAMAIA